MKTGFSCGAAVWCIVTSIVVKMDETCTSKASEGRFDVVREMGAGSLKVCNARSEAMLTKTKHATRLKVVLIGHNIAQPTEL